MASCEIHIELVGINLETRKYNTQFKLAMLDGVWI